MKSDGKTRKLQSAGCKTFQYGNRRGLYGNFDFVVYECLNQIEIPVLAIELDGKEHFEDEIVKRRDQKKNEICRAHHMQIIRVENSYARRYNYIKDILISYFSVIH